jgi:transcriptional regulator with XRE-family HTH domain
VRSPNPRLVARQVGRRIAELRVARHLTQEQLAEAADVSARYVQSVEAGDENLTITSLVRFASLLGVAVADLFKVPRVRQARMPAGRKKKGPA